MPGDFDQVDVAGGARGRAIMLLALAGCGDATPQPTAQPMSVEDFRRELVNLPLCGTPEHRSACRQGDVHHSFADGTAMLAGDGKVARGIWDSEGSSICRRDINEPADQRLCVTYERLPTAIIATATASNSASVPARRPGANRSIASRRWRRRAGAARLAKGGRPADKYGDFTANSVIIGRFRDPAGDSDGARLTAMLVCVPLPSGAATAATKLTPAEIQSTFFTGEAFTAATPSGVKFKMTFTPDGKAKRAPAGKGGARSEGEWKLDETGYCTTWKGSQPACYTVVAGDKNKWSVMRGAVVVAIWSK